MDWICQDPCFKIARALDEPRVLTGADIGSTLWGRPLYLMSQRSSRPALRLLLSAFIGAAAFARAETPPANAPAAIAAVGEQLNKLQALLKPLERDYPLKDRLAADPALKELQTRLATLESFAARGAADEAAGVRALNRAAAETTQAELAFAASAGADPARVMPAATATTLLADVRGLEEKYDALFPRQARASSVRGAPPAPSARRVLAVGAGANVDPARFFDQDGGRGDGAAAPTYAPSSGALRGRTGASAMTGATTNAPRGPSLHTAPVPPPPSVNPGKTAPPPAPQSAGPTPQSACAEALKGQDIFVKMCQTSPTIAPLLAGLVESLHEQFGTVSGLVTNLAFMMVGLLMTVVSGFGVVAKFVVGMASFAMLAGTLYSLLKQGFGASMDLAHTDASDAKHAAALKTLGKVGGTVLILAMMSFLGFAVGKTKMGGTAMEAMTSAMGRGLEKIGIKNGVAGLDALIPASVKAVLNQLFPTDSAPKDKKPDAKPEPKPADKPDAPALPRSAKAKSQFTEQEVLNNAALKSRDARMAAARSQLGADDAAARLIADAHDKVPCPVGGCTYDQLKAKLKIMKDVPPATRDAAIRSGLAGELPAAHAGEKTFLGMTHTDISFMSIFEPEAFAKLAHEHPEVKIIADDEKFRMLDGLSRDEADRRISSMYPNDYMQGYQEWNAYLNRKLWREQAGGRPIPGDPGGPPASEVDRALGGAPHLPPKGVKGVEVPGRDGTRLTLYSEADRTSEWQTGEVNAYAPDLKRVGSLPYTIRQGGQELEIGHMFVDPSARSQMVGETRVPGVGTPMIQQMIAANPRAAKVKAVLFEDNGQAFYQAFSKTPDYFAALRSTPLYKALAKQGFTEIVPPAADWRESPFIPFEVTKPGALPAAGAPEVPAAQPPIFRSEKARQQFTDDVVHRNSEIAARADRIAQAMSQLGVDPAAARAIADAHDQVPCPVGGCTPAQIREKLRIMKDLPPEKRDAAIRAGLAGEPAVKPAPPAAAAPARDYTPTEWARDVVAKAHDDGTRAILATMNGSNHPQIKVTMNDGTVVQGTFAGIADGKMYFKQDGHLVPVEMNSGSIARVDRSADVFDRGDLRSRDIQIYAGRPAVRDPYADLKAYVGREVSIESRDIEDGKPSKWPNSTIRGKIVSVKDGDVVVQTDKGLAHVDREFHQVDRVDLLEQPYDSKGRITTTFELNDHIALGATVDATVPGLKGAAPAIVRGIFRGVQKDVDGHALVLIERNAQVTAYRDVISARTEPGAPVVLYAHPGAN